MMLLTKAIKERPLHAVSATLIIFFISPVVLRISTPLAFEIWYRTLFDRPINAILYVSFSLLIGAFISLYSYTKATCPVDKKDTTTGFGGAFFGTILGVCPACFSFIGFFLPLSGSIFLTTYASIFTSLSIAIIVFSIYRLGGFKKAN